MVAERTKAGSTMFSHVRFGCVRLWRPDNIRHHAPNRASPPHPSPVRSTPPCPGSSASSPKPPQAKRTSSVSPSATCRVCADRTSRWRRTIPSVSPKLGSAFASLQRRTGSPSSSRWTGTVPKGILNVAFVISADGEILGCQTKNQVAPEEDAHYVPGRGREMFEVNGVPFAISICHEGWRYPESVRWGAVRGATVVFHPHHAGNEVEGITVESFGAASVALLRERR